MDEKISVIIPIYKVEKYLNRCLESVVNQSYQNLEIILVDDGSPDNCPKICDEWAEKDERIKVIHKENGGLSDARNYGLKKASGDYIVFVDSDDLISKKYIEYMYYAAQKYSAEIIACNVKEFYKDNEIDLEDILIESVNVYNSESALKQLLKGVGIRAVAWNKMYVAALLKNEKFEVGRFHEDEFFTYRIIDKAERIVYVESKLYFYRQRQGSIMTTFSIRHVDALEAFIERLEFLKNRYPTLYVQDKSGICILCAMHYRDALRSKNPEVKQMLERIRVCRKQIIFKVKEISSYSLYEQLYIIGTAINMDIFCRILNWKRRIKYGFGR